MKTALIIRHVPHEGLAGFRDPIESAGYHVDRIDVTDPDFGSLDLCRPDLLIMMGGPMAVYEQDRLPWIRCQIKRLAIRLEQYRPTLGVCLGAQMIAAAMGARVYKGPHKEVGFRKVSVSNAPAAAPLRHLQDQPVLHWHGDTFDLPPGTVRLASSELYENQAFARGSNILGLQFHAEMGLDERFHVWTSTWPEDISASGHCIHRLHDDHERLGAPAVSAGQAMIADWLAGID